MGWPAAARGVRPPETIALKWAKDGTVTDWNPTFGAVMLDLGLGVELCWPRSPRQKGSVENLVGWVKGSFFKQRRFVDDEDLHRQLAEWHVEVNTQRPSRATGIVPAMRLAQEQPRLRSLRVQPDALALRVPICVGPTGYVVHDSHPYSMHPDALGLPGTLYLYRDRVRIVAGRFQAEHDRKFGHGEGSTLPEHRAPRVAAVSGKRAKRYLKREHLIGLGDHALTCVALGGEANRVEVEIQRPHAPMLAHPLPAWSPTSPRSSVPPRSPSACSSALAPRGSAPRVAAECRAVVQWLPVPIPAPAGMGWSVLAPSYGVAPYAWCPWGTSRTRRCCPIPATKPKPAPQKRRFCVLGAGEEAEPDIYGKLLRTLHAQAPKIMEQYKAKGGDFSVVVKDNQVIIRAKPKP